MYVRTISFNLYLNFRFCIADIIGLPKIINFQNQEMFIHILFIETEKYFKKLTVMSKESSMAKAKTMGYK